MTQFNIDAHGAQALGKQSVRGQQWGKVTTAQLAMLTTYATLKVFMVIATRTFGDGSAKITHRQIQQQSGVSRATLFRALAELKRLQLVSHDGVRFFIHDAPVVSLDEYRDCSLGGGYNESHQGYRSVSPVRLSQSHPRDYHPLDTEKRSDYTDGVCDTVASKITNLRTTADEDERPPRAPKQPRLSVEGYPKVLAQVARQAEQPLTAQDRAIWTRLLKQYGDSTLRTIIHDAVKNKRKLEFGNWVGANLTAASIAYYAKTFYKPDVGNTQQTSDIKIPDWMIKQRDNENVINNFATMYGLSPDEVRRRIDAHASSLQSRS